MVKGEGQGLGLRWHRELGVGIVAALAVIVGACDAVPEPATVERAESLASEHWPVWQIPPAEVPAQSVSPLALRLAELSPVDLPVTSATKARAVADVAGLATKLEQLVTPVARSNFVSVHVREIATGAVLFDHEGDEPRNPASNIKLVTAAAALELLGPEFRFETRVLRADDKLYIVGEGDPSFDPPALTKIAEEIVRTTEVASLHQIVVDDSAFSPRTLGPGYATGGTGMAYQAPSGALSLNFNTVSVVARALGSGLVVDVWPASSHLVVDDTSAGIGRGLLAIRSLAEIAAEDVTHTIIALEGKLRIGRRTKAQRRVVDPGLFVGGALAELLAQATDQPPLPVVRGSAPPRPELPQVIATHESLPLQQIVARVLAWSNNFMAEQLLRALEWQLCGRPGSWVGGAEVIAAYWLAMGLDPTALLLENGSGLGRRGRITARALVDLLVAEAARHGASGLLAAMPAAGEPGTLRGRMRRAGKRVRAKTGTLKGVSGLSGVVFGRDGAPKLAFSVLSNAHSGRGGAMAPRKRMEDRVVMALLRALDAGGTRPGSR